MANGVPDTDPDESEQGATSAWLGIAAAAAHHGVTTDAIRARIKRGSIEARKANDGSWRVLVYQTRPLTVVGDGVRDVVDGIPDINLVASVARLEERVAARDELIVELRCQLEREQRRADGALEGQQSARREAETLREQWEYERQRVAAAETARDQASAERDDATAALEAWRAAPWWRRLWTR